MLSGDDIGVRTIVDLPERADPGLGRLQQEIRRLPGGGRSASGGKFSPKTPASESGFS
jgi:hypothetical protein